MILDVIIRASLTALSGLLGLLPTWTPPDVSDAASAASGVWVWAGWLNAYVPVVEAVAVLGVFMAAFVALYAVRLVLWALTKVHLLGGSDG